MHEADYLPSAAIRRIQAEEGVGDDTLVGVLLDYIDNNCLRIDVVCYAEGRMRGTDVNPGVTGEAGLITGDMAAHGVFKTPMFPKEFTDRIEEDWSRIGATRLDKEGVTDQEAREVMETPAPQEGDWVTADCVFFYEVGAGGLPSPILRVDRHESWLGALRQWAAARKQYPGVWFVHNDGGYSTLLGRNSYRIKENP